MTRPHAWLLGLPSIAICGCAALQMGWYKPGASQSDFAQDKYACMENSQEHVSGAYVNPYGGAASSGTITNIPLFQACMEARGYVWTSMAQVDAIEQQSAEETQQDDTDSGPASSESGASQGIASPENSSPPPITEQQQSAQNPDKFVRQVDTIQTVFTAQCDPSPPGASVCGPLSALTAEANSLLRQVRAGTLSEKTAEQRLKVAREEAANTPDY